MAGRAGISAERARLSLRKFCRGVNRDLKIVGVMDFRSDGAWERDRQRAIAERFSAMAHHVGSPRCNDMSAILGNPDSGDTQQSTRVTRSCYPVA